MPTLLCFGFGFSAATLVQFLRKDRGCSWIIKGTTRCPQKAKKLEAIGIEPLLFDGSTPLSPKDFEGVTHLLSSIPPNSQTSHHEGQMVDPVLRAHYTSLRHSICRNTIKWIGYLSSTGVYGNHGGALVTEETPITLNEAHPSYNRARAEREWLSLRRDLMLAPVHVFRLSGIYGPGRSALDSVRQNRAQRIIKPGHVFCRIHVDDIALVLCTSFEKPKPCRIYNVADDKPAPYADVVNYACQLLNTEPPPEVHWTQANLSPMLANFYADCRRVDNTRLKEDLSITLQFPTYQQGLQHILETETVRRKEPHSA